MITYNKDDPNCGPNQVYGDLWDFTYANVTYQRYRWDCFARLNGCLYFDVNFTS